MFMAALSTIAKRWENSKHPSIGEWITKYGVQSLPIKFAKSF